MRLSGAISPGAVVKKDNTYLLYYIGADGDRSTDGGPRRRALGVATSTDGVHFKKYSGNPIIKYLPHNNQEEGIFSVAATLDAQGKVVLYYGALIAPNSTSESVNIDIRTATSTDGFHFSDGGEVVSHSDSSVWGYGDELFPVGVFERNGVWYVYYVAKGKQANWDLGLAWGPKSNQLTNTKAVLTSGSEVRGSSNPIPLNADQVALFVARGSNQDQVEARLANMTSLGELSSPAERYILSSDWRYATVYYDSDTNNWFMYHRSKPDNEIDVWSASATAPSKPTNMPTPTPTTTATPKPAATPVPKATSAPTEQPPSGASIVTNIAVSSGKGYVLDKLSIDKLLYTDREYVFTSVPNAIANAEYIRLTNYDKTNQDSQYLTFSLAKSAAVYVAYDERASTLPSWLAKDWSPTSTYLQTTDNARLRLYTRQYNTGQVTLGGNAVSPMAGAESNYVVIVWPGQNPVPTTPPAGNGAAEVSVSTADGTSGGQADVDIDIRNVGSNYQIGAVELVLTYDESMVTAVDCVDNSGATFDVMLCNTEQAGKISLNAVSTAGVTNDTSLARIQFQALSQPGKTTSLDLQIQAFADTKGNPLPVNNHDGGITVTDIRLGEVTCDNKVDVVDALYILQHSVELRLDSSNCPLPLDTLLLPTCDVNSDASCNTVDGLFVLQCTVGMPNEFCSTNPSSASFDGGAPAPVGSSSENSVQPGETVIVSIKATDSSMSAATFEVRYDPAVLTPVSCAPDPNKVFDQALCNLEYEKDRVDPDLVRFSLVSTASAAGDLSIANVIFQATAGAVLQNSVWVTPIVWVDADGQVVPTDQRNLQTTIIGPDGTVISAGQLFLPTISR